LSRETDDHSGFRKAEGGLRSVLKSNPTSVAARTQLGSVLLAQHKFSEALAESNRVLATNNQAASALAIKGDAEVELGRYSSAASSYEALGRIEKNAAVFVRQAQLAELTGDTDRAFALLGQAYADAIEADLSAESQAWYELRMATFHHKCGRPENAKRHYNEALNFVPDYGPAMLGKARLLAASESLEDAETLLRKAVAQHGEPPMMAELGTVLALLGTAPESKTWLDKAESGMREEATTAAEAHYREYSRFLADNERQPELAVEIAEKDLVIRQGVYSYDTLAWAQFRTGRLPEATRNIQQALATGTQDSEIHFHAGMIYDATQESEKARKHFDIALKTNPYFSATFAPIARQKRSILEK
jgi:tetratricopeptide (TPR) repeat protein